MASLRPLCVLRSLRFPVRTTKNAFLSPYPLQAYFCALSVPGVLPISPNLLAGKD